MPHVAGYADDRQPGRRRRDAAKAYPSPDRRGVAKRPAGERPIDDRDAIGVAAIARVERAAFSNPNIERCEVAVGHDAEVAGRLATRLWRLLAFDDISCAAVVGAERQHVDEACALHARNTRDRIRRVLEEP